MDCNKSNVYLLGSFYSSVDLGQFHCLWIYCEIWILPESLREIHFQFKMPYIKIKIGELSQTIKRLTKNPSKPLCWHERAQRKGGWCTEPAECPSRTPGPSPQLWAHHTGCAQDADGQRAPRSCTCLCGGEREEEEVVKQGSSGQ